ncbi:MAG: 30S ribosome-binding factor RbfA [Oscillospiraceae bacterium]|jgi:ribosome-binding factor A|nr:30S ribosome-binding factor RbfA [Oscillospiraceae bacterium]
MPSDNRMQKINEEILRELSRLVGSLKDPRVQGLVSLTHVEAARDLSRAKVSVSVLGDEEAARDVARGLKSASGFLRHELAVSLNLRYTPQLQFLIDDSLARGAHIYELLARVAPKEEAQQEDTE